MTCYRPWTAYKGKHGGISEREGPDAERLRLPCGNCIGCRMDRSQSWALRCRHEASFWDHNAFVTLTYDDEHLPWHGSLSRTEPRLFIRYLRRHLEGEQEAPEWCPHNAGRKPIRYFGCGEYGSLRGRAHYHLLLFNVRFRDVRAAGRNTYTSELVSRLWKHGSHVIGTVTGASASYVAGYALKKVKAWEKAAKYGVVDPATGEYVERTPEFPLMSLKPAIGWYWYEKYKDELRNGYCVIDGRQVAIPRLYRDKLALDDPAVHAEMQLNRHQKTQQFEPSDSTPERLAVKEKVALAKKKFFRKDHMEE